MSRSSGTGSKRIFLKILLTICVVFLLSFSATAYLLKRGISIDSIDAGGVVVSDISLVWKEKLELQVAQLSVDNVKKSAGKTSNLNLLKGGIQTAHYLAGIFSRFSIERFAVGQNYFGVALLQQSGRTHALTLNSDELIFESLLTFNKDSLDIDITEARISRFNSDFKGKLQLDGINDRLTGTLTALINGSFPVSVDLIADDKQLTFQGREAGKITEIKPLVDLFGLSHNIQRWITDYLKGSRYHLVAFKGTLPWDNPKEILSTLEAEVRVDDTEYTFAPGLEPLKARYTNVYFQEGVLIIKPHDSTFYGQGGGESWLDINFNDPKNIVLTAYIKTRAVANDDILTLLDYYKIRLPFKQVGGLTDTDLQLAIVLNKIQVQAGGIFEIDQGVIEWDGKKFHTEDARIKLVNSDVAIENLKVSYADVLTAQVSGSIQARNNTGDLAITLDKLVLRPEMPRVILDPSVPAQVRYRFGPDGHFLEAQPSSWLYDSTRLNLETLSGQVYLDDLAMDVSPVQLTISSGNVAELSGYITLRDYQVDLTCDLLEYHVGDLQLTSSHIPIGIQYDNGLVIITEETSQWEMSQMPVTLYPSKFAYHDHVFTVHRSRISYGSLFDSYLSGFYNTERKKGLFSLQEIDVTSQDVQKKLELGSNADVEVSRVGGKFVVYFPNFDLTVTTDENKNWSAVFGDLSAIYSKSEVLQKYKIREGRLSVSSEYGKRPYRFSADIRAPYPLLVEGGKPTDQIQVSGKLTDEGVFFTVNKDLDAVYRDSHLSLKSRRIGYNINAIIQLLRDLKPSSAPADKEQKNKQSLFIDLNAEDSQVYLSPQSKLLADSIVLRFADGELSVKLEHGPGHLQLRLENDTFLLEGTDLNDEFMGALIQNSRVQGGRMSMASTGSFDDFSIVFEIYDTNIRGLTAINNVLAFLNTGPALMTFSLPEYNAKGLPISSAVAGMTFKNKVGTFESLEIKGPEFQVTGIGEMDFVEKLIDMDIFIKTQAGRNVGKIPLIGYVFAGKDEDISTSLKISGEFGNPKVRNSLVHDIVAYPIEVLIRTLRLPFHITEKVSNQLSSEPEKPATEIEKEHTEK